MKWSSPLPRLECRIDRLDDHWSLGFHLSSASYSRADIGLDVYLLFWAISFDLTWPERSRP